LRFENFLIRNGAFVDPGAIEEKLIFPRWYSVKRLEKEGKRNKKNLLGATKTNDAIWGTV
jgi:hypothetical protein